MFCSPLWEKLTYNTKHLLQILSANPHRWTSTDTRHTLACTRTRTQLPVFHICVIKWQLALLGLHHPPYSFYYSPDTSWQKSFSSFDNMRKKTITRHVADIFLRIQLKRYIFIQNPKCGATPTAGFDIKLLNNGLGSVINEYTPIRIDDQCMGKPAREKLFQDS